MARVEVRKPPKLNKRTTVIFIRNVPRNLKDMYKAYCARRGRSMNADILEYIRNRGLEEVSLLTKE